MKSPEQAVLNAIASDIDQHPEVLRPVDAELAGRCRALTAGVDVDLDVPLPREPGAPRTIAVSHEMPRHARKRTPSKPRDKGPSQAGAVAASVVSHRAVCDSVRSADFV
jgi:hypothetical protein